MTPEEREACSVAHNEMLAEAISCSPDSWSSGVLTVECDGSYLSYSLKNSSEAETAEISGELRSLCEEFAVLMWNGGDQWSKAIVNFFNESGEWKYKTNFEYETENSEKHEELKESAQTAPAAENSLVPEQQNEKPWWKFW